MVWRTMGDVAVLRARAREKGEERELLIFMLSYCPLLGPESSQVTTIQIKKLVALLLKL